MISTVGKKIGLGFTIAILALAVIGVTAYRATRQLIEASAWVAHTEDVLRGLEQVISSVKDVETGERGYVITGDDSYLEPYQAALNRIDRELRALRSLIADNAAQQRRLATLEALITQRLDFIKKVIATRQDTTLEDTAKLIQSGGGKQMMDTMLHRVVEMESHEKDLMSKRQARASNAALWSQRVILFGGLASAALLALIGWLIAQNIAGPLAAVTAAAARIADGDIAVELKGSDRFDEVGLLVQTFQRMCRSLATLAGRARQIAEGDLTAEIHPRSERDVLGNAFASMSGNLRRIMQELLAAANVLAASATDIMASTQQLAASAAETAAAVSETTATLEAVKQISQTSSEKARSVSTESQHVAAVARTGQAAVEQTIAGMSEIRQQMGAVAESILTLSAQSQTIGEIVATVDDLAAQSKLLAVNAAIEAAKAGDEGKGFAVVAQEVRSLAEQSKQATTQVRGILSDIQKATGSAVLATEQGGKAVEAGARQSASSSESMRQLAESLAEAAQAAAQIAATSQQQFVGLDQVALAMESIKAASIQSVGSTRQAESAAAQIHNLGEKLQQLVERFKL